MYVAIQKAETLRDVDRLVLNAQGERFANKLGRRDYVKGPKVYATTREEDR